MEEEIVWSVPTSRKGTPKQAVKLIPSSSVEQARLDRITRPNLLEGQTYLSLTSKMKRDPSYTPEWLQVRLKELEPLIQDLSSQVWFQGEPPQGLTSTGLYKLWDRLEKLRGQKLAIQSVLHGHGSSPIPTGTSAEPDPALDPFLDQ